MRRLERTIEASKEANETRDGWKKIRDGH